MAHLPKYILRACWAGGFMADVFVSSIEIELEFVI